MYQVASRFNRVTARNPLPGDRFRWGHELSARVVHQNVDVFVLREDLIEHRIDVLRFTHIAGHRRDRVFVPGRSREGGGLGQLFFTPPRYGDLWPRGAPAREHSLCQMPLPPPVTKALRPSRQPSASTASAAGFVGIVTRTTLAVWLT